MEVGLPQGRHGGLEQGRDVTIAQTKLRAQGRGDHGFEASRLLLSNEAVASAALVIVLPDLGLLVQYEVAVAVSRSAVPTVLIVLEMLPQPWNGDGRAERKDDPARFFFLEPDDPRLEIAPNFFELGDLAAIAACG